MTGAERQAARPSSASRRAIDADALLARSRRPLVLGIGGGGDVVGEHKVIFAGPGERIELVHIATDRGIFAQGAIRAALWARGQAPGLYSMRDVIGL